ncbi:MAG: hypothetical protein COW00_04290 [Bdellovibrio sp. CG12_big_fil_rev_8_21_14_0_65_39_13]|nr:MAG: hypothetical protein COW78_16825 [Bdellovibrio sp. CG22_combo_CG10-13_8_21_14_all_39_27]PIQ61287.1 MAG: hypothetical protein COW00_04290 [Bdellovibrio sp. CG12_big_fil_rev_8_21_14_0_65_39_13]PIR36718.1 MAG: hypothetical protein COV37_01840 [Bdellovibrio sp. CG11_big_fil_rev_8_21_14_0_20_39_38]PJB53441.1 MAG: hypothetical protein CO099_07090 [Bdellovibrio sp. CG_4_9_14_3_um_filter_39_7]
MTKYLFLDSSLYLQFGLLDENFKWIDHVLIETTKSSNILHSELNRMLEKNRMSMDDIEAIFSISGPGSYTGVRLVEGVTQILDWQGKTIYSIHHFELPYLVGVERGSWISEAFKGEVFEYSWNGDSNKHRLLSKNQLDTIFEENLFSHRSDFLDLPTMSTSAMVFENAELIFSAMKKLEMKREPFYYRELETEFKVTQ